MVRSVPYAQAGCGVGCSQWLEAGTLVVPRAMRRHAAGHAPVGAHVGQLTMAGHGPMLPMPCHTGQPVDVHVTYPKPSIHWLKPLT